MYINQEQKERLAISGLGNSEKVFAEEEMR
jgi:hypothetical protein